MKILLTNDDGYQSGGLMLLAERLVAAGQEVFVVAPSGQRSAFSHATNFYKDITYTKLDSYCGAKVAYTCSGTPVDCVKFAIHNLGVKFDLLISGPNNGENAGVGILYSGTVAAAEEGVLYGVPSIALSRPGYNCAYGSAVEYVVGNLQQLAAIRLNNGLLNINVPNLPMNQIRGVKICKHSNGALFDDYLKHIDGDVWQIVGDRVVEKDADSDVYLLDQGYVTITPLSVVRTDFHSISGLRELEK